MRIAGYLLAALAVFLVLCGVSAVAVPLLIDQVVLARVGESIGRQVTIDRLRFNPFTLALSAKGIRVAGQQAGTGFVTIESVQADLSISSVRHFAPVIDSLRITAPKVDLQRTAEQRFNFSDIVERLQAKPTEPDADGEPARFALNNLEISGGEIALDDQVLRQQHLVRDLRIGIPFISNLDYATDITVQPALSALVNGSPLSLSGETVPFSETRETSLDVVLNDLDIATYLRLSPVPLAFTVPKGKLSTNLKIRFAQEAGAGKLDIGGSSRIDDLQIDTRDGPRLVLARSIALGLDRIEPLAGRYALGELRIDGLDLAIERRADGSFPIVRALVITADEKKPAAKAGTPLPASASGAKPVQWGVRRTSLQEGHVTFTDQTVTPGVRLDYSDMSIELAEIGNQQTAPAAGSLSLKQNETSTLSWQGELDLGKSHAAGRLNATVASIAPYVAYLAGAMQADVETGAIEAQASLDLGWADGFSLALADGKASVQKARLRLPDDKEPAVALGRLTAQGITVALGDRLASVERLELSGADVRVERDVKGQLNLQRIAAPAPAQSPASAPASAAASAWSVRIDRIDLDRNAVTWRDLNASKPVNLPITQLAGRIEQVGTDLSLASKFDLKARVGRSGAATARGDFVVAPWSMQTTVQLERFALASFDPYVAQRLALGIDEGSLSASGQLRLGGDRVRYRGRLQVDGLSTRERTTSTEAIRWNKLLLEGIDVDVNPAILGPDDRIAIGAVTLSDFFAKVVLSEQGRFNLQDIVRTQAQAEAQARAEARSKSRTAADATGQAPAADEGAPPASAESSTRTAPAPQARSDSRAGPVIRLAAIKLERGSSNFTDRFVQPNYTVNLTDLNGGLTAMASNNPAPAELGLKGRIGGDAPIDIAGKIIPLGTTLFADVRAQARGIDLPTLSPYSAKYVGYAIEKGTLSLDVHYRIENERLEAQNRVLLDQLTLGEKIDSPDATSLPVQFALGLLKNSKGEIDVSLPIAGSLNDPQFSIGGIITKAIVNLLTRVISAPFSALASAFGGGDDKLSFVEFRAGTARLTEESIKRLGTMSKALSERPALKLEIAGRVDPKTETDAIGRQRLLTQLQALKRRQSGGNDAADGKEGKAGKALPASVTIGKDEYPLLLKQLYDDTELPDKPRNALGMARTLSVPEMENLLLGAIEIDAEAVTALAARRAQVVREWLVTEGKVPADRMLVLAPRTSANKTGPDRPKPQCAASCAEFSLVGA